MGNTPNPVLRSAGLSRGISGQPHQDASAGGTGTGFNEYMNSLREQMLHPSPWASPEAVEGAAIAYTFFSYQHQFGNIERALRRSLDYFPSEIDKFGRDTWKGISEGVVPAVKQAVTIIAVTTLAGTLAGALGGLGVLDELTIPAGAAVGLQLGLEIVDAMMIYEALKAALQNIESIIRNTAEASEIAWNAGQRRGHTEVADIEEAAQKYAHAFGALFALIVNIVVAWILKRGGEKIATLGVGEVFDRAWQKVIERGSKWSNAIGNWLRSVRDWIKNLFKPKEEGRGTQEQDAASSQSASTAKTAASEGTGPRGAPPVGFAALAKRRQQMGLPPAGAANDTATLSQLEIGGKTFDGINSGLQNPRTPITLERVNAQTKTHAEAEAVQNAVNADMKGSADTAEMWVDRDPCTACGQSGGLRSLARNLGVNQLIVHSPSGTQVFLPTK